MTKSAEKAESQKLRQWKKADQQARKTQSASVVTNVEREKELERVGKTQLDLNSPPATPDNSPDIPELTMADVRGLFSQIEVIYNYNFKVLVRESTKKATFF